MSHPKHSRGYTMVELMVAGAIGTLIIAATLAVFSIQRSLHRNSDRLLSEHFGASVAIISLMRDLENAGFHFSAPVFAIRPRDNISAALPNGDGTTINAVALGAAGPGVILGTDALEIVSGNPTTVAGVVNGVVGGGTVTATVTLDALDPLSANDADAGAHGVIGPLLVFQSGAVRCLGKVNTMVGSTLQLTIFSDFDGDLTGAGSAVAGCPAAGMSVYALMLRKRYLVYQDGTGTFGLYVQNLKDPLNTTRIGVLGGPVLLAEGIEDLQISYNMGSGTWCNQGGMGDCDVMSNPSAIQGVQFQLVSRGTELVKRIGQFRPTVLNHGPGAVDDVDRLVIGSSLMLRNLTYVSP